MLGGRLMFLQQLGKHVKIGFVALATLVWAASSSSAAVLLDFQELPNEEGVHLTGTEANGSPIDVTLTGSSRPGSAADWPAMIFPVKLCAWRHFNSRSTSPRTGGVQRR